MAGAPKGRTLYVMVPTTAIALTVTLLLLANLRFMDRHWRHWVNNLNAKTRKKMLAKEQPERWNMISQELEETTRRILVRETSGKRLPAESTWHYFHFWLIYICGKWPVSRVRKGLQATAAYKGRSINGFVFSIRIVAASLLAPVAFFRFLIYGIGVTFSDVLRLIWFLALRTMKAMLIPPTPTSESSESDISGGKQENSESALDKGSRRKDSFRSAASSENPAPNTKQPSEQNQASQPSLQWLESPPRPIKNFVVGLRAADKDEPSSGKDKTDQTAQGQPHATSFLSTLLMATISAFEKVPRPSWLMPSRFKEELMCNGVENGGLNSNGMDSGEYTNGKQTVVEKEEGGTVVERPKSRRKLLGKTRAGGTQGVEEEEGMMWVGWSSV